MKKKVVLRFVAFLLSVSLLPVSSLAISTETATAGSTFQDHTIVLSNISKTGATSASPGTQTIQTVIGKISDDGNVMIKLQDLEYLGAQVEIWSGYFAIEINGQVILFTPNSTYYTADIDYSINVPGAGTEYYIFSATGSTSTTLPAQYIDGVPYVCLSAAAHQCGALIINYDSATNTSYVFHFRVNGSTSYDDGNSYIVGGSWLSGWSSKGTIQLTPHFKVNELWASSTAGTYNCQLKISVASLQAEENIRYYYNNNSSLNVTSGFRTWQGNYGTGGADKRSLHMRGRAIDATSATTVELYNNIYNEFKGNSTTPDIHSNLVWISRVSGTSASLSGAYELEKMPYNGSWWIHLGVLPGYLDSM